MAQFFADEPGLAADRQRGAVLGRRRHRHVDLRYVAGGDGDPRPGHHRAAGEWIPQCFGTESEPEVAAFCVSEPDAGSTSRRCARAPLRRGEGRMGAQRPKAWATNGGIAASTWSSRGRPELGRAARPVRDPAGHSRAWRARSSRSTASAPRTPLKSSSTTAGSPAVPARRQGEARRAARAARRAAASRAGGDADLRGERPDGRRPGDRDRARRLRVRARLRRERKQFGRPIIENQAIAFTLADMKTEIDAARCSSGAPRGWPATGASSRTPRARWRSSRPARSRSG